MAHRILHRDEVEQFYASMRDQRQQGTQNHRELNQAEADEFLRSVGEQERRRQAQMKWYATHDACDGEYPGTNESESRNG